MIANSIIEDLSPADLGMPEFSDYRQIQREALDFAVEQFDSGKRFVAAALPTGAGKSLYAFSLAKMMGWRAVYLTGTKGLQDQYGRDFERHGLVDIRGKTNYQCNDLQHLTCQSGSSLGCRYLKGKGCGYETAKARARNGQFVNTNYQFWMTVNDKANGIERTEAEAEWKGDNPVELLVLDEGHDAVAKLADYISCRITEKSVSRFGDTPASEELPDWKEWARRVLPELEAEIRTTGMELAHLGKKVTQKHVDVLHGLESLYSRVGRVGNASGDDWVVERQESDKYGRTWQFDSVFPGKYAEGYLFCGVPRVLVMSATLKPKTMGLLGVKREEYGYKSWRRIFPATRHPIYQVGCRKDNGSVIQLNWRTEQDGKTVPELIDWMDREIIAPRLDRKGLIGTVSYTRQQVIMRHSRYALYMIGNNSSDPDSLTAQIAAEQFRRSKPPTILVSPSFGTGWDFPGEELEYIILFKVPIVPAQSKVMRARCERDESYAAYMAMQAIEQQVGRGMRFEKDQCEVFLIDGGFGWFMQRNAGLAQDWFPGAVRKVVTVPRPPRALWKGER